MSAIERDLLKVLAEVATELQHIRQHLHRIESVQCRMFEFLERKHYPQSTGGRIEVN